MPLLADLAPIRSILDRDRTWAAYAIGDLDPDLVGHCEWHASADGNALVMLYRGFEPPILFAMGDPLGLRLLLPQANAAQISLHIRPEALEALGGIYSPSYIREMWRMAVTPETFIPDASADVRPITEHDAPALTALYDDGHRRGEGPAFFSPAMLRQHSFHGVWEDGALVAVAGTHLYSPALGICTIGNVYTRSDRRGRGLGARVTTAVVAQALADRIPTIVLNVGRANTAARRLYERLGFSVYCAFLEGEATRTG